MRWLPFLAALFFAPDTAIAGTTQTLFTSMGGSALPNSAGTIYSALTGNGANDRWTSITNEASSGSLLPAGTLNSFRFTSTYDTNSFDVGGPGANIIATVMKNGSATTLTCTVTGKTGSGAAGQEQCDVVPVVVNPAITVATGDRFTLRIQMQGNLPNPGGAAWSVDFTPAVSNTTVMAGSQNTGNSGARHLPPGVSAYTAAFGVGAPNDASGNVHVPIAGTITGVLCRSSVTRGANLKTEVIINGAAVAALDCTVTPAAGTNPVIVAATRALAVGDTISLRYNNNGSGMIFASLLFAPTTPGKWWGGFASGTAVNWASFNILPLSGYARTTCTWNGSCDSWPPPHVNIDSMRVNVGAVPNAGKTLAISVARHIEDPPGLGSAIASSLLCTFTSTSATTCTSNAAVSVDAVNDDDYWQLWADPSGNPIATTLKVSTVFSSDTVVAAAACSDGLDNDGDTLVDFPADVGCSGGADAFEQVDFSSGGTHVIDGATSIPNESVLVTDGPQGAGPAFLELREGGVIDGNLTASGQSAVAIAGGRLVGDLIGADAARASLRGGEIFGDLYAWDQSIIEIHGTDFNLPLGELGDALGRITGVLLDGTPISVDFEREVGATIRLIPEPDAQLLAGVALMTLSGVYERSRLRLVRSA